MDPQQVAPAKSRRRWILGVLLLVLIGLGTWWSWPRGDGRFVGRWSCIDDASDTATGTIVLNANGTCYSIESNGVNRWYFPWRVEGNEFVMGRSWSWKSRGDLQSLAMWPLRLFGVSVLTVEKRYDITKVEDDAIAMQSQRSPRLSITLRLTSE